MQFDDIESYNDQKLTDIWNDIQDLMREGRVWNHKIAKHLDGSDYGITDQALSNIVLKELRNSLEHQGIIDVELHGPEKGDSPRKIWVKKDE